MNSKGWLLHVTGPLSWALCAFLELHQEVEERTEGKERKSNDLEVTGEHHPRKNREMQTSTSLCGSTLVKYVAVGALPKCLQKLDRRERTWEEVTTRASNH